MRLRHGSPGQAMVEVAVSLPLLVLLLLVVVEGALYVHAVHVVQGAAREGAHAAASEDVAPEDSIEVGRARARHVLRAGLGQYAGAFEIMEPAVEEGSVVVEIRGGLPFFLGGPGQDAPVQLPVFARARASREFFRPQGAGGY